MKRPPSDIVLKRNLIIFCGIPATFFSFVMLYAVLTAKKPGDDWRSIRAEVGRTCYELGKVPVADLDFSGSAYDELVKLFNAGKITIHPDAIDIKWDDCCSGWVLVDGSRFVPFDFSFYLPPKAPGPAKPQSRCWKCLWYDN